MRAWPDSAAIPTMVLERTTTPMVSSADQPRASLGTFVCPQTGGAQNWTFVPLKDFFSNPVLVDFPGTNTFRITDIGDSGSYNVNYLIFVATTNTATLRPYIASGFPYPGASGVQPDLEGIPNHSISFTIANRQTAVTSVQLLLNSVDVTSGATFSNNAAGTVVSYQPATLMPAGLNTVEAIIGDGAVLQTNTWQFTVAALTVIPPADALPLNGNYAPGFAEQIAKADDSSTNIDFPPSVARAEAQLAGTLTNSITLAPYANEALNGGSNTETGVINYAIDPWFYGFTAAFPSTNAFPDLPAGGTNYVAMAATMYVYLTNGIVQFGVTSDDGFNHPPAPHPPTPIWCRASSTADAATPPSRPFRSSSRPTASIRCGCFISSPRWAAAACSFTPLTGPRASEFSSMIRARRVTPRFIIITRHPAPGPSRVCRASPTST